MPAQLSHLHLAWHIPAITHPDVYPLDVLAIVLGQGKSSRLYLQLRQKQGLVHTIEAHSYTPAHPGLFLIEATASPDKRDAAIAGIREEVRKLHQQPISDAELQKAIKQSVSNYLQRLKTTEGQASDLAHNEILLGDPNFSAVYLQNLRKVTRDDVLRVAQQYLRDDNLTITSLNPTGTLAKPPAPTTAAGEIHIQKFELPNGLRLLVREDPKLPLVHVRAALKGGVIAETDANNGITKLTARMLLKGTRTRTAEQIAEEIESIGGQISYFSGNNSFGISAESLSEDLDRTLDIVADVLQQPSFPEPLLARERDIQLAEIKAEQDQILRVGQQLLREALYSRHPYRLNVLGKPETVSKLGRSDLVEFHRRYVVPNNLVLAVLGNVKAEEVHKKVRAKFGQMKPVKPEFAPAGAEVLQQTVRSEHTLPKEQAVLLLGYSGADLFSPDRFALELLEEAYSGMASRIFRRIREELGLAYYVGAYQLLGLEPGYFAFYVGTTAGKLQDCETEFLAELRKLSAEGLSEEELARAKNSIIGQRRVRMQDNAELGLMVALDELYGLGYDFFKSMDEKYRAVTTADIKRIAQTYFAGKPYAVAVVKPNKM
jgi:zinc protease